MEPTLYSVLTELWEMRKYMCSHLAVVSAEDLLGQPQAHRRPGRVGGRHRDVASGNGCWKVSAGMRLGT